jgi:hypothetical protein
MMLLSLNHNAKGLTYWLYPSTSSINIGSGELGKIFQTTPGMDFIFGTNAIKKLKVVGEPLVDASAWILGNQMMVGVASEEYVDYSSTVTITLPKKAKAIDKVLYGDEGWTVKGMKLEKDGLKALEVGVLVLDLSD